MMRTPAVHPPAVHPSPTWSVGSLTYTRGGLIVLFSWLLWGDFAWSLRDRALGSLMQFLLKRYEVSDTVTAIMMGTVPSAIGLLLGPIVSYCSDRHRGPRGRRIPFLLYSSPLVALSIIGLGLSPLLGRVLHEALGGFSPGLFPSIILVIAFWWVVFDVSAVITSSTFGALVNDVVPPSTIGKFYGLFRIVSLLVGIAFNYWLLEKAERHLSFLFILTGATFGIGVTFMCFWVKEGVYPPPEAHAASGWGFKSTWEAVRSYFKACFSHTYYIWFFLGNNLALLAFAPVNMFSLYYAKSLGMSMADYGKYIAITYCISLSLAWFLGSLADRLHPLRLAIGSMVLYGIAVLWGSLEGDRSTPFVIALIAHGVLSGCYFTGAASLGQRIFPRSTFAQLSSASCILMSLMNMALPPILGGILDASGHLYRLTFLAAFILTVLALGSLWMLYRGWIRHGGDRHYVPPE